MSLRQMEYFVTVVAAGSFTRAAEQLHVTQPALSHQIKALERYVGGPLLERLPRGVRLTPMGRAFLPHAEIAVGSAAQAERAARAAAGAVGGELHVAAVHSVAAGLLPPVFAQWRRERPGVELVLHEYARDEDLDDSMERGVADIAVGHGGDGAAAAVHIGDEEVVVVLPPGDPLAAAAPIALGALAGRDWIRCAMEPVVQGRPFIDLACERAGFSPRTAVRTEHTTTAVAMAAAGAGVAVVPSYAVPPGTPAVPLTPPWRRPLYAWSRTTFAGPAAALITLLTG
ncbi:LysR family transcriptional regulator [Actinacidiphila bryophytorum]|jgi:DNA-binding transcriptional LysR family regulator|uniref:LysR family transcriptional regulator n=1 Tax=Actinacidiphila bryophytorum TaxID=1436133 RepID=UPI002176C7EA|nr:LysR family transcriptional regulator [Actinacidiphila bryophytorum]UWE11654.1 LysR family transcriptional regulator [Actinacidiphila bryophytorum]